MEREFDNIPENYETDEEIDTDNIADEIDESDVYYEDLFEDTWDEIEAETAEEKAKLDKKKDLAKKRKARIDKERESYRQLQEQNKSFYTPTEEIYKSSEDYNESIEHGYDFQEDIPKNSDSLDVNIQVDYTPEEVVFKPENSRPVIPDSKFENNSQKFLDKEYKTEATIRNEQYRSEDYTFEQEIQQQKNKEFVEELKRNAIERETSAQNYQSFGSHGVDFSGGQNHAAYEEKQTDNPSIKPSEEVYSIHQENNHDNQYRNNEKYKDSSLYQKELDRAENNQNIPFVKDYSKPEHIVHLQNPKEDFSTTKNDIFDENNSIPKSKNDYKSYEDNNYVRQENSYHHYDSFKDNNSNQNDLYKVENNRNIPFVKDYSKPEHIVHLQNPKEDFSTTKNNIFDENNSIPKSKNDYKSYENNNSVRQESSYHHYDSFKDNNSNQNNLNRVENNRNIPFVRDYSKSEHIVHPETTKEDFSTIRDNAFDENKYELKTKNNSRHNTEKIISHSNETRQNKIKESVDKARETNNSELNNYQYNINKKQNFKNSSSEFVQQKTVVSSIQQEILKSKTNSNLNNQSRNSYIEKYSQNKNKAEKNSINKVKNEFPLPHHEKKQSIKENINDFSVKQDLKQKGFIGSNTVNSINTIQKAQLSSFYIDKIKTIHNDNSGFVNSRNHKAPVMSNFSYSPSGIEKVKIVNGKSVPTKQHVSLNLQKGTGYSNRYFKAYRERIGEIPVGTSENKREYFGQNSLGQKFFGYKKDGNWLDKKDIKKYSNVKVLDLKGKKLQESSVARNFSRITGTFFVSAASVVGKEIVNSMREDDAVNLMVKSKVYVIGAMGIASTIKDLPRQARRAQSAISHGANYVGNAGRYFKGMNNKLIQGEIDKFKNIYGPLSLEQSNRLSALVKAQEKNQLRDYGVFTKTQYNKSMIAFSDLRNIKIRDIKKQIRELKKMPSLSLEGKEELQRLQKYLKTRKSGIKITKAKRGRRRLKMLLTHFGREMADKDETLQFLIRGTDFLNNRYVRKLFKETAKLTGNGIKIIGNATGKTLGTVAKITHLDKASKAVGCTLKNSKPAFALKKVKKGINGGIYNRAVGVKRTVGQKLSLKTAKNVQKKSTKSVKGIKKIGTAIKNTALKVKESVKAVALLVKTVGAKYIAIGGLILVLFLVLIQFSMSIITSLTSIIMDDTENISSYVKVLNDKQADFSKELEKKKTKKNSLGNKYDNVTFNYLNGSSTNNTKEILSMAAVRFSQDFDDKLKVKSYLKQLFDDSHIITEQESEFYSCSGCKERTYKCTDEIDDYASSERIDRYLKYADRGGCVKDTEKSGIYDRIPFGCKEYETIQKTEVIRSFPSIPYSYQYISLSWDSSYVSSTGYIGAWKYYSGSSIKYIPGSNSFNPTTEGSSTILLEYYRGRYCMLEEKTQYDCTFYKCNGHKETYCDGKHQDLTVNISCLSFDAIFWADSSVNGNLGGSAVAGEKIGHFKITAYCTCHKCCHPYDPECTGKPSKTASGTTPTEGRTIAVDPSVIPMGSHVVFNNHEYIAEDTGGAIKGKRIDLFFNSHQAALNWGVKYMDVYWAEAGGNPTDTPSEGEWEGWTKDNIEWCKNIYNQDWADIYEGVEGLDFGTIGGSGSSLTDEEVEAIIGNLPENLSPERKEIIKVAAEAIGKIPYYWGGAASGPGWEVNNFGSPCTPDANGRAQKGLDCSHFVDWVYWTAIGNNLGNSWTGHLWDISSDVGGIHNLQPGDIGLMNTGNNSNNHVGIYVGNGMWIHCTGSPTNNVVLNNTGCFRYYRELNIMKGR